MTSVRFCYIYNSIGLPNADSCKHKMRSRFRLKAFDIKDQIIKKEVIINEYKTNVMTPLFVPPLQYRLFDKFPTDCQKNVVI